MILAIPQSPSYLLPVDLFAHIPELPEGQASDSQGASDIREDLHPRYGGDWKTSTVLHTVISAP